MLKNILFILLAAGLIVSCQSKDQEWPTDLAGKKALLTEKKNEQKSIKEDIEKLEHEINLLEPSLGKDPVLVTSEVIQTEDFKKYTTVQAAVESEDAVYVSSESGGRIIQLNVQEGDYVKKGQLIAKIDMESLKTQMAEIRTQLKLAETVFERQKKLWDQNIGSEMQYLQAESNVESLNKSMATLQTQLDKANIYAPLTGYVDQELVKMGEVVGPGSPIIQILNTSKVKVVADVPESYLGKIKKGDKVKIYFPAIDKEIEKTVTLMGRTIDPANRTFKVEVNTSNPDGMLKPNLLAELKFMDYEKEEALTVPVNVVLEEVDGDSFVYVAVQEKDKKVAKKKIITIGKGSDGRVVVEEGLSAGDEILIEGARNVTVGDPLIISNK